jgi:hypothetical protein
MEAGRQMTARAISGASKHIPEGMAGAGTQVKSLAMDYGPKAFKAVCTVRF